jgi:hypothetical protein
MLAWLIDQPVVVRHTFAFFLVLLRDSGPILWARMLARTAFEARTAFSSGSSIRVCGLWRIGSKNESIVYTRIVISANSRQEQQLAFRRRSSTSKEYLRLW